MAYKKSNPNGQATMANSEPIVIASDQSAVPISGTVTANATLAAETTKVIGTVNVAGTVPVSLASTTITGSVAVTGPLTDAQLRLTPVPVSGTVSTGGLTDTQIRATPLPIGGTVTVANPTANPETGLAKDGTDITTPSPAMPAGGVGIRGWLSAIWTKLNASLAVTGTFWQATQPVSGTFFQATQPVSVPAEGVVSTVNSSAVNLAANAVFTGTSEDLTIYSNIKVSVFSSHASATDGLSIQQSSDGTNWDNSDVYTIPAATYRTFSVAVNSKFFRLVYTNGATLTTSLRIQVLYSKSDKQPSSVRPQDARSNENDFVETLGFLMGYNGTSWDRLRTTIANGLAVDVTRLPSVILTAETTKVIGTVNISTKQTYRASTIIPLVAAVTVNVPFFNIIGSATKTVTVKRITVSGMTLTAVGYFAINVEKLSTASTLGTSTTLVATALDSNNAAVTAVVKAYTAAPTKGTLVGTLRCFRALWQATTATATGTTDHYDFNFAQDGGSGIVLRGVAQEIALTFPVVLSSAGTLSVCCEWTEE